MVLGFMFLLVINWYYKQTGHQKCVLTIYVINGQKISFLFFTVSMPRRIIQQAVQVLRRKEN